MSKRRFNKLSTKIDQFLSSVPYGLVQAGIEKGQRVRRNRRLYDLADRCISTIEVSFSHHHQGLAVEPIKIDIEKQVLLIPCSILD